MNRKITNSIRLTCFPFPPETTLFAALAISHKVLDLSWCIVYICTRHMYITIDESDPRALYQQVVDEVKALIARSELVEGSTLPPVRQVAADLGVNLNTIAFAYRQLQKEGLIRIRHGAGATVVSRTLAKGEREPRTAQLRAALAQLVLSGLSRDEIKALVADELAGLMKGQSK